MNVAALENLAWLRLNDAGGTYYPNMLGALNEAQRLFALISRSIEATVTVNVSAATPVFNLLGQVPNFLRVRRLYNSAGTQLRPTTLAQLEALDSAWQFTPGLPTRYTLLGLDCLCLYPQPAANDTLSLVAVVAPNALVNPSDVPQIRPTSHYALASYAAYAVRQLDGGQEFERVQPLFAEFMQEAMTVAELVKSRNRDTAYELPSFELERTKR